MSANKSDRLSHTRIEDIKRCCQAHLAIGGSPPCIDIGETLKLVHEVQELRALFDPISALTRDAKSSLLLCADDIESAGRPSEVYVMNGNTKWEEVRVEGVSISDALSNAAKRFGR